MMAPWRTLIGGNNVELDFSLPHADRHSHLARPGRLLHLPDALARRISQRHRVDHFARLTRLALGRHQRFDDLADLLAFALRIANHDFTGRPRAGRARLSRRGTGGFPALFFPPQLAPPKIALYGVALYELVELEPLTDAQVRSLVREFLDGGIDAVEGVARRALRSPVEIHLVFDLEPA